MAFVEPIRNWYARYERPISSFSLIFGFVFDAVTLRRVDMFWENFWIIAHLFIVGFFIALIHIRENQPGDEKDPHKAHFWYVNILQFFFGGILSTYLVFYFRSADILVTWPFIFLLALAFWANESLKRHYVRLSFQLSLFFLSVYSFAIFLLPILMHQIGTGIFLLSGLSSIIFMGAYVHVLFLFIKKKKEINRKMIFISVGSIFVIVNFLYFTNLIPPIPLSLKDAGVFHLVQKNQTGSYFVAYEDLGWRGYFQLYQNYKEVPGDPVYAYSAVFSPGDLNITIVHEWQYLDPAQNKWLTKSKIQLPLVGGRENGFRTYSESSNLSAGKWRVNVETLQGQVIGRLRFNIVPTKTEPLLTTEVK